jgi:hypothetical protein
VACKGMVGYMIMGFRDLPTAMLMESVSYGTIGTKSAATTVNLCPSSATCAQLLMPTFMIRSMCDFPGVNVVSAYLPPNDEVIEPFTSMLSAVGGPFACSDAAFTVKMDA